jgi:hypothetical protein
MAPETVPLHESVTPEPRTHRSSNLLLAGALMAAAAAGSLWVTAGTLGSPVAAAGAVSAPTTTMHDHVAVTATPRPAPAAAPSANSTVTAAAATLPAPAVVPTGPPNLLQSAEGSLDTSVTVYSDCSGATELTHAAAAIDTCVGGRTYFVGHNAGVFTPLLTLGVGDVITWDDNSGAVHKLRIVAVRDNWLRANGVPPLATANVIAQFQTCETAYPDGSHDRILDAVAA